MFNNTPQTTFGVGQSGNPRTNKEALFNNKKTFEEFGLPFLDGNQPWPVAYKAKRSPNQAANRLSMQITKAVVAVVRGYAEMYTDGQGKYCVIVGSKKPMSAIWDTAQNTIWTTHGEDSMTYYFPLVMIAKAVAEPAKAADLIEALDGLLDARSEYKPKGPKISDPENEQLKGHYIKASEETYYWMEFEDAPVTPTTGGRINMITRKNIDDYPGIICTTSSSGAVDSAVPAAGEFSTLLLNEALLKNPDFFSNLLAPKSTMVAAAVPTTTYQRQFVGDSFEAAYDYIVRHRPLLLVGRTASAKTTLVEDLAATLDWALVKTVGNVGQVVEDLQGANMRVGSAIQWVDGKLTEAMRLAVSKPVLFFFDEINRANPMVQNVLIEATDPRRHDHIERLTGQKLQPGYYYCMELKANHGEMIVVPVENMHFVAAMNVGAGYTVHGMDVALARRFPVHLDIDYLPKAEMKTLLMAKTGVKADIATAMTDMMELTSNLFEAGKAEGEINPATLRQWADDAVARKAGNLVDLMKLSIYSWATFVFGRTPRGGIPYPVIKGFFETYHDSSSCPKSLRVTDFGKVNWP